METTNTDNQELSVTKFTGESKFGNIDDGMYQAMYKGYRPFHEPVTPWGERKGVRLMFEIISGPFKRKMISFKGNMFRNDDTGQWVIGKKSQLANAIRTITGGAETINAGHIGSQVFIAVENKICGPRSKRPGEKSANVKNILPLPVEMRIKIDTTPTPANTTPVPAFSAPAPVAQKPATQVPVAAGAPVSNPNLLNDLTDLSDFANL